MGAVMGAVVGATRWLPGRPIRRTHRRTDRRTDGSPLAADADGPRWLLAVVQVAVRETAVVATGVVEMKRLWDRPLRLHDAGSDVLSEWVRS
jgi:hypothetical protein